MKNNHYTNLILTSKTTTEYVDTTYPNKNKVKYLVHDGTVKLSYDKFYRWNPTSATVSTGFDGIHFECEQYVEGVDHVTYNMTLNASELLTFIPAILEAQKWYA